MDLSFSRNAAARPATRPGGIAVLLADAGARQAASVTARAAHALAPWAIDNAWLAPGEGAFSAATAAALTRWKEG